MNEDVILIARKELIQQNCGLTQQAMATHQPRIEEGQAIVEYVQYKAIEKEYHVFFGLEEQPYNFVVVVHADNGTNYTVSSVYFEAGIRVSLVVKSSNLSVEAITEQLHIFPTKTRDKGELIRQVNRPATFTLWTYEPHSDKRGDLEKKLDEFLTDIKPYQEKIRIFSKKQIKGTRIFIDVVYRGHKDQMWGWELEPEVMSLISQFNIPISFDIYAYGPDLPEYND